ncbi:MAG: DNA-directed RNA polymerase subunit alpha [Patescibacteria group bacterium]|nr:DNA-directed RNA polymerase subunit alpha [Patescibacteria group bacterium]MDD5715074.1 DNA-directed RNA polymerase subunit alpha [Patescibacteria group bacterium]
MESLALPEKHKINKISENQAEIVIEPCYPGYGTTIGNAIRRVLLSSLPGAAITAVRFKNVTHEFTTIQGVKEDIVEIILNLKRLRFKLHSVDETTVTLKVKGDKKVTGKDIKCTSEIEIVNPSAEIATITDKNSSLEMELTVQTGRGYVPVENTDTKKLALGTIAIDAIYSPVKNVNYEVENVRVGQMTNYDRVIINILTDGTITPENAILSASQILADHFIRLGQFFSGDFSSAMPEAEKKENVPLPPQSQEATQSNELAHSDEKGEGAEKPKKKRGRPKKEK